MGVGGVGVIVVVVVVDDDIFGCVVGGGKEGEVRCGGRWLN